MTLSDQTRQFMILFALSRYDAYGKDDALARDATEAVVASAMLDAIQEGFK